MSISFTLIVLDYGLQFRRKTKKETHKLNEPNRHYWHEYKKYDDKGVTLGSSILTLWLRLNVSHSKIEVFIIRDRKEKTVLTAHAK